MTAPLPTAAPSSPERPGDLDALVAAPNQLGNCSRMNASGFWKPTSRRATERQCTRISGELSGTS